jgi:hypothetical protein
MPKTIAIISPLARALLLFGGFDSKDPEGLKKLVVLEGEMKEASATIP